MCMSTCVVRYPHEIWNQNNWKSKMPSKKAGIVSR